MHARLAVKEAQYWLQDQEQATSSRALRIPGDCAQTAAACSSRGGCGVLVTMADTDETKPDVGNLEHVNIKVKSQVRGLFLEQHTYRVATSPAALSTLPVLRVV